MASYSDLLDLSGQVALVTGGGRGIGAECAAALDACGAEVWLLGRDEARLKARASTLSRAGCLVADIADEASVKAAIMRLRKESGRLDILVNNAGVMTGAMTQATPRSAVDEMLSVNVAGAFLAAQYASRLMAPKKSGSIINMASIMGVQGAAGYAAYSASKAAVIGMTKAMAKEFAPLGIRVNALAPGFIETDMTAGLSEAAAETALKGVGFGRFGAPEDVARAALFLASPMAGYVSGQVIGVDGVMTV